MLGNSGTGGKGGLLDFGGFWWCFLGAFLGARRFLLAAPLYSLANFEEFVVFSFAKNVLSVDTASGRTLPEAGIANARHSFSLTPHLLMPSCSSA